MDSRAVSRLLTTLASERLTVIKAPEAGLLMMSVRDPFDTDFHLGEILVTEAYVERDGMRGYGMVMGDDPERALAAASIDLLSRSCGVGQKIERFLASQSKKIAEKEKAEKALVARTRVRFESMNLG